MNHIYRIVWNYAMQVWTAVAETATGRGRSQGTRDRTRRAVLRTAALALPAAGIGLSVLAQTVVLAPGQQAQVYVSPNGTTVVDIAGANAAGVSHNRYTQYNVDAKGLVLNNTTPSGAMVNGSQLAGAVFANRNAVQGARVIVNEVVSANRSVLAGFTEVVGQRADVVVANPYGITCTGCGFINTDRVTLATGLARWGADGSLAGFDVSQGDILINGSGLNATAQQILDLVTRSAKLDAAVNAQDLGIYAGTGQWDYASRSVTAGSTLAGAPAYAIDSAALGGMYANSIRLVATEAGVGVRMLGDAAATTGDFTLTAAGKLDLRGRVSAQRDVLLASASNDAAAIALSGNSVTAAGKLQISAVAGGISLDSSTLAAGQGGLSVQALGIASGGASHWEAEGALTAKATGGNLALGDTGVSATGDVALAASGDISVAMGAGQGIQSVAGNLILEAGGLITNAGVVTADAGNLALRAGIGIASSGTLNAGGNITVGGSGGALATFRNDGSVLAAQVLAIGAAEIVNTGTAQGASLALDAQTLVSSGGLLAMEGAAVLNVAASFQNSGVVQAATDIVLQAQPGAATASAVNTGKMLAGGALDLWAASLANASGALMQGGQSASIHAATFSNAGTALLNQSGAGQALVDVTGTLANSGLLQAAGDLTLNAQHLDNTGDLLAKKNAAITLATLTNQAGAALVSEGALNLGAGVLDNQAGATVQSRLAATLTAGSSTNAGTLLLAQDTAGTADFSVTGAFTNTGNVESAGGLQLTAGSITNRASIVAQGAATLAADSIVNEANAKLRGAEGLSIEFGAAGLDNAGLLQAGTGQATGTQRLSLYGPAGAVTNTGGIEGGTVDVTAASLVNEGSIAAAAGGSLFTVSGQWANRAGAVISLGSATSGTSSVAAGTITNEGVLQTQAGAALLVGAGGLSNTGSLLAAGALDIQSRFGNAYTAVLEGNVTASGMLTVQGNAASSLKLGGQANVQAGAVDIETGAVEIAARAALVAQKNVSITAGSLVLGEESETAGSVTTVYTGRLLGAMGKAAGDQVSINVANDLGNAGLIYSATNLDVTASNVHVGENGAVSALQDLVITAGPGALDLTAATVPASGNLTNEGLLFAGKTLSARVSGTLHNKAFIAAGAEGVDDGTIDLVAHTLVNNRDIVSQGNVRIIAKSLRNEVAGGDRRVFREEWDTWQQWGPQWTDGGDGGNLDFAQTWAVGRRQYLEWQPGEMPTVWPQITATKSAALYFNSGKNLGGLIQAVDSVHLQGFTANKTGTDVLPGFLDDTGNYLVAGGAIFENNSLATVVTHILRRHTHTRKEAGPAGGAEIFDWRPCSMTEDAICHELRGGNQGYVVETDAITAVVPTNIPGYAGARIYTASLTGGGFSLLNEGSDTPASFQPAMLQGSGVSLLTPGRAAPHPGLAGSSVLPGAGTQTGWIPVDTAIQPVTVVGANGQQLQTGLTFGGITVKLPNGANSLYVLAKDPAAGYLVEMNPLYGVGGSAAGSDYLRDRLGFSTDQALMRLGDGNYESWLVQQQLIAQTGSMLLKAYGSQDAQMRGLMDSAAQQAGALGLVWGRPLTAAQQAALSGDIVWMVSTVVNGQSVLVPVVYLSQATKDNIRTGAIISAQEGSLKVDGVGNSGTIDVTIDNTTTIGKARGGIPGAGPTGSLGIPVTFRDQSFEIVKAYLLSESPDKTVRFGDVNAWLEKNKSNPEAIGEVLPFAFQRFMSLAQGGGLLSESDKSFVTFVGEYAKSQRLAAIDDALAAYDTWKNGPKLGQSGKHAMLTSLFDLGESPPDTIMALAKSGITWNSNEEATRIGTMLGVSLGAGAAGGTAAGTSAALMNQIFPYLGRALASATGSSITALSTASGPLAIVTAAAAIAGQAIAKVVKDASFEKDLLKLRAEYESVAGADVNYWLKKEGGAEQIMMSMAKMMAN